MVPAVLGYQPAFWRGSCGLGTVAGTAIAGFDPTVGGVGMREFAGVAGQDAGAMILSSSQDYFKFALMLANLGVAPNGAGRGLGGGAESAGDWQYDGSKLGP